MAKKSDLGLYWEPIIKTILNKLDIPTKKDIDLLHNRLDKLEQLFSSKQTKPKEKKPAAKKTSASSIVLDIIANKPKGADFKTIKAAAEYDDKKLRNIIFRLHKSKKIKRVRHGFYKAV